MRDYTPGQAAHVVHSSLKASVAAMENAKQNAVLWFQEVLERGLFKERGYSSMNQYAEQELGFSKTRTGDFLSICRKLKKLPQVADELRAGTLGYTTARVLVQVADEKNEGAWLQEARTKPRRQLEQEVKRARKQAAEKPRRQLSLMPEPRAVPAASAPVRVSLEMSPLQFARYEALWEQIRKVGAAPADQVEALLEIMACHVAESTPRGDPQRRSGGHADRPPYQVHIHRNQETGHVTVPCSRGELALTPTEVERACCDCEVHQPGKRNTSSVAPSVRREVLARDRHRCRRPGCGHAKFLEVHHIIPRSRGGGNQADNLITLCSACHGLLHERRWRIDEVGDRDKPPG